MDEQRGKIEIVEYLRGVAALSVAWFHLTNEYPAGPVQLSGSSGWLGVAIFFVISGFVLPYSIWRRHGTEYGSADMREFAWRRVLRIEPPYLVSVVLTVVLWHLSTLAPGFRGTTPQVAAAQVLSHVFYLPRVLGYEWLQPVYWTLGYEFAFYGLLAISYPIALRHPLVVIGGVVGAAEACWLLVAHRLDPYIPLFGIGMIVFIATCMSLRLLPAMLLVVALAAVSAAANPAIAVVGAATALLLWWGQGRKLRGGAHEAMLALGAISYSLYVTHVPIGGRVINLGARIVATEAGRWLLSFAALATCVAFAALYWKFIERPFVRLAHRRRARLSPQVR